MIWKPKHNFFCGGKVAEAQKSTSASIYSCSNNIDDSECFDLSQLTELHIYKENQNNYSMHEKEFFFAEQNKIKENGSQSGNIKSSESYCKRMEVKDSNLRKEKLKKASKQILGILKFKKYESIIQTSTENFQDLSEQRENSESLVNLPINDTFKKESFCATNYMNPSTQSVNASYLSSAISSVRKMRSNGEEKAAHEIKITHLSHVDPPKNKFGNFRRFFKKR